MKRGERERSKKDLIGLTWRERFLNLIQDFDESVDEVSRCNFFRLPCPDYLFRDRDQLVKGLRKEAHNLEKVDIASKFWNYVPTHEALYWK